MPTCPTAAMPASQSQRTPSEDPGVDELWRRYKQTNDVEVRNRLLEHYLPLVQAQARRLAARLPDVVDTEDLMSAGVFGLLDAIQGFDLDRHLKFQTYSAQRIRGAILDELRSLDWVPRLVRQRARQFDQAARTLQVQQGRPPTGAQVTQKLGVDPREYERINRDAQVVGVLSLSHAWTASGPEGGTELEVIQDPRQINPLTALERLGLKQTITRGMCRADRLILLLYYYEQLSMKDIGRTLDLSESRVSQMHTSIIKRLRAQLRDREEEFVINVA